MGHLFFPHLISKLCLKQDTLVVQDEEVIMEKRFIDKPLLKRLMSPELSRRRMIPIEAINEMMIHQAQMLAELTQGNDRNAFKAIH